jgi:hypothetical protein
MTNLEKLAQWHEAGAVCEVRYDNAEQQRDHHTVAAATIRTAMAEIERLRTAVATRWHYDVGWHNGLTEGERKATAAIVVYLRKMRGDPAYYRVCMEVDNLRNHIEAGHHLPGDAVVYAANSAFNAILAAQPKEQTND